MLDPHRPLDFDSTAAMQSPADEPFGGTPEARPEPPATDDVPGDEKTVISSGVPIPLRTIPAGLNSRELGQLLVGQRLDELWLEEYIGGGGMGAVFRAVDTRLQRNVAVKVLSTHQAGDGETARRFEVEAQSAARLDHPNIARVHYVGDDRGVPYIVFEYIEGINLRDLIYQVGSLSVGEAINYTIQVADALLHAWQRDVVHRDIKPSNILITSEGQAKLVDMGLARFREMEHGDGELTTSGMTLGTFDYIAPEQARNPKHADTRSDIYSLGCTLFFMLTGRPPFYGGTALQKLLQHQGEAPPSVAGFRGDVPAPVANVLETMLAKRIEDRFQSPGELLATLTAAADQLGIGHVPVIATPVWRDRTTARSRLRRHAPWLIPALLLVAGVFGIEQLVSTADQPAGFLREQPATESPAPDRSSRANPSELGTTGGEDGDSPPANSSTIRPTDQIANEGKEPNFVTQPAETSSETASEVDSKPAHPPFAMPPSEESGVQPGRERNGNRKRSSGS